MNYLKERVLKFSVFNSRELRPLSKTGNLVSALIAKNKGIGKKTVTNLSAPDAFDPLANLFNVLLITTDGAPRS